VRCLLYNSSHNGSNDVHYKEINRITQLGDIYIYIYIYILVYCHKLLLFSSNATHILNLASIWGPCPPQPVYLLGHAPSPNPLQPIGSGYFRVKLFPYKYHKNLNPLIIRIYTTYKDGTAVFRNVGI